MSEHTPITGELREAVEWEPTFCGPDRAMVPQPEFDRICDAIDAVHAALEAENAELRERLAVLDESADSMHDGWVRLPVDADGVPIRVGDVMDSRVDYLFDGKPFTVRALVLCEDGWEAADGRFGNRYEPDSLHHHHAPTVEDVLREMLDAWGELPAEETNEAIVAEYAAKLQLREDS